MDPNASATAVNTHIHYTEFLAHCGIRPGSVLYISSDLKRLIYQAQKHKEKFQASLFLQSLRDYLGPEGTLLIPAFNYLLKDGDAFDRQNTIPITGALAVEAMKDKAFMRTVNPMHSFLVWGKDAEQLLQLPNRSSFGEDSVFHYLYTHQATMLAIDVNLQQSLTFAHYVEDSERVGYRKERSYQVSYKNEDGGADQTTWSIYAKKPGYINDVNPLYTDFKKAGILKDFMINGIPCFTLDLPASYAIMQHDLRENKGRKLIYFDAKNYIKDIVKSIIGK